jgi:His-Xaa-Ser system radical SAM maturase HxsB
MTNVATKKSKFKQSGFYQESLAAGYQLLPFRFLALDDVRYVLTNDAGEHHVVPRRDLADIVNGLTKPGSDLYNELKSKHFIMDSDSSVAIDLLALKVRTKLARLADFTALHIFVASLRCEHSCPYCQVSRQSDDKDAFDMTEETASKGLDFTFKSPAPAIKIEFQGGEPLLNFSLIKWTVLEAERRNIVHQKDLEFVITTNLALLTDEHLDFCREHNVYISTSLDGPADIHTANRPRPGGDSYDRVIAGIQKARAYLGPDKVSALMTTTTRSLDRAEDIIDEYIRQGFTSIFLRPLSPYGFAIKTKWYEGYDIQDWLQFYFKGLCYIIEQNKNGLPFVEAYASLLMTKMFSPQSTGYVDLQSPAGIGIAAIVFNYDADVYAADEARMLAEMGDKTFKLGNLHTDTYEQIMLSDALLGPLESSIATSVPQCSECALQPYCGSDPLYHHATQGDPIGHKALSGFCAKNMAILRHLITLLEDDPEARKILLSWVRI